MHIVLLFLGRGHTSGDVVAYLPKPPSWRQGKAEVVADDGSGTTWPS